jgi:transcriptional regulator with XRE-family HTH domain
MKSSVTGKWYKFIRDDNIRAEMARKRITYQEMAEIMGYKSKTSFNQFIKGIYKPGIADIACLSKVLEKPIDHFFNLDVELN